MYVDNASEMYVKAMGTGFLAFLLSLPAQK